MVAQHDLALVLGGLFADRPDRQDPCLGRIDDRVELLDAKHAQIADGKRSARVVGRLELARIGPLGQIASFAGDLADALLVDVADDGDDQAPIGSDGHADVHSLVADHAVFGERHVDFGHLADGDRNALHDHVVEGDLDAVVGRLRVDLLAQAAHLRRVDGGRQEKVGDRARALGHAAGDRAPHLGQTDALVVRALGGRGGCRCCRGLGGLGAWG